MDEKKEFSSLCKMKYKDQAVWMLNGFWGDCVDGNVANEVWLYVKKFVELENLGPHRRGEEGNELDQFWSAKFLEDFNSSLTAIARKEALRKIDQDNNGMMSCIEYLTWRFNRSVGDVVRAPQGDNRAALEAAQAKLDAVMRQLAECEQKIANNNQALADLKIAEGELKVAYAALKAEEDALAAKVAQLEALSAKPGVAGGKAKNELSQLKSQDPLPLRQAKITQEAALRKVEKQKKACEEAKQQLEASYVELESRMAEAREELDNVKKRSGGGKGAIWWMERELFEADRRLPQAKQKYNHSKPFFYEP